MKTEQEIQRTHDYLIQKHVDEIHRLIHQLDALLGIQDDGVQSSEQRPEIKRK